MLTRMTPSSASLTGGDLSVDVLHTEDSVALGDGTNLLGTFAEVEGVRSLPAVIKGVTKTKLTDSLETDYAEIDDVGGEKALKVSVIASVGGGGGGTAATDEAAFTAGATQGTPLMGQYDADGSADLTDGKLGIARMTAERSLNVNLAEGISTLATAAKQDTIIGHLDGVEGLLGTIDTDTGNIATSTSSMDTKLSTIIGHVDGLEANQATEITSLQLIDDPVFADDAAFTAATSKVMMIGGQYQSSPNALDDGDAGSFLLDSSHRLQVNVATGTVAATQSGTWNITNISGTVSLPSGASTLSEQQTQTTALQLIDDIIFADNAAYNDDTDKVAVMGGVYDSAPTALTSGDAGYILLDADHAQQVVVRAGSAVMGAVTQSGTWNVGTVTTLTSITNAVTVAQSTAANLKAEVVGSAAHDNGSPGVPIMVAGRAKNTNATAVADGDVSYLKTDLGGRLIVAKEDRALTINFLGDIADQNEETMLAAGGAGVFHDLTHLAITNSHATSSCVVFLRDTTGGSTVWQHSIPPSSGMVLHFDPPMKQTTANTNWTIDCTTSVSTIYYTGIAIKRIA